MTVDPPLQLVRFKHRRPAFGSAGTVWKVAHETPEHVFLEGPVIGFCELRGQIRLELHAAARQLARADFERDWEPHELPPPPASRAVPG